MLITMLCSAADNVASEGGIKRFIPLITAGRTHRMIDSGFNDKPSSEHIPVEVQLELYI